MKVRALRGFKDILPSESYKWQFIESKMRDCARSFSYDEVRTPVIESTSLFNRSVGESSDIVQKEMYTFISKGDESLTMKPESTAGAARMFIEHSGHAEAQPYRVYYLNSPHFRYEKPQAGRLREHHQFGVECFGSPDPIIDAEVVTLARNLFDSIGIFDLVVHINNIGCKECRPVYNQALKEFFAKHLDSMCDDCKSRFESNPLRILDCKDKRCRPYIEKAPKLSENTCDNCNVHFDQVLNYLTLAKVNFIRDDMLVRGLDYYTRTVFEFISEKIGAQGTVCGGGRYDYLVEELGGPSTPAAGFGMGMERLLLQIETEGIEIPNLNKVDLYIANIGEEAKAFAWQIANDLRGKNISAQSDAMNRSLKSQFKYADKIGAKYVIVLGDDEINKQIAKIRSMSDGVEEECAFDEIAETLKKKLSK